MEIEIPSPSVFLRSSPAPRPEPSPPPKKKAPPKPRTATKPKVSGKDETGAVTKPKQSKSRNGCMTCKKKRLKCDETKPSCVQCQKRNVVCEGYKKDFKWRSFEETTFNNKVATKNNKKPVTSAPEVPAQKPKIQHHPALLENAFADATRALPNNSSPAIASPSHPLDPLPLSDLDATWNPPRFDLPSPSSTFDLATTPTRHDGSSHSSSFAGSPSLLDLLLPGTDMNQPPDLSEERPPMSPEPYQPGGYVDSMHPDDADEEIVRDQIRWRDVSPARSDTSLSSRSSGLTLLAGPTLDLSAPEMLLLRFDRQTCGILSVKDGPNENPWRTLVWPLAQDSPALYHAISSMTAFHGVHENPRLRLAGVAHMHKSIKKLAADIENMRLDSALATSLALAFGEGWDEKTSTGIQHLRGARIMVNNALVKHRRDCQLGQLQMEDALRLRFLCNTYIYMDVIARLTSTEEAAKDINLEDVLATVNPPMDLHEVDPLMGCATTLFPVIGNVASLIQKVRMTNTNSLTIVSQANGLQQQLLQWQTPNGMNFIRPEDPSSEVEHSIRTADAYRMATLLYLHQAVPEIPSDRHEAMAKRVLLLLASVPLSSRTTIVQIFPLFAASCEVTNAEDRAWVTERWDAMMARLTIGNVDSCWKVIQEVWRRRDAFEAEKSQRMMRLPNIPRRSAMADIPLDQIEPEYTVRGRLHWIGVMSEWQWEVFLG